MITILLCIVNIMHMDFYLALPFPPPQHRHHRHHLCHYHQHHRHHHQGLRDVITDGRDTVECGAAGSPRRWAIKYFMVVTITIIMFNITFSNQLHMMARCGGQGDLLAGSLATFLHWAINLSQPPASPLLAGSHQ